MHRTNIKPHACTVSRPPSEGAAETFPFFWQQVTSEASVQIQTTALQPQSLASKLASNLPDRHRTLVSTERFVPWDSFCALYFLCRPSKHLDISWPDGQKKKKIRKFVFQQHLVKPRWKYFTEDASKPKPGTLSTFQLQQK